MLRYRLITGTLLALGVAAILLVDERFHPFYPSLLAGTLLAGYLAARELIDLLPQAERPRTSIGAGGVVLVLLANWFHVIAVPEQGPALVPNDWAPIIFVFVAATIAAFFVEVILFSEDGKATHRIASCLWTIAYLGVLPSFLVKLRWLESPQHTNIGSHALALAIFVPKCGDIGAYAFGRLWGRTPFAPRLSPKKTWEGFFGGTLFAVAAAYFLRDDTLFRYGIVEAILFGLFVGWAGVFGDLAESLIKRDCRAKDAGNHIPGFGGLLDVFDSLLFAAPVAYYWFARP